MNKVIELGNIVNNQAWDSPQRGRVYCGEGISPALQTGGGMTPKIVMYESENDTHEGKGMASDREKPCRRGRAGSEPTIDYRPLG